MSAVAEGIWRSKVRRDIRSSGCVIDTLEPALGAVAHCKTFEEAVLKAVNRSDDADTVGAVAGALWGCSAIPETWTRRLAWNERLVAIGCALWAA